MMMNKELRVCPVCGHYHETLVTAFNPVADEPLLRELQEEVKGWVPADGVCTRCIDQAMIIIENRSLPDGKKGDDIAGFEILPIPYRLSADEQLTGKGITICMIDSGFEYHPDLTAGENRILAMLDMTQENPQVISPQAQGQKWHGTMTTVVCAGDGHLSGGKYKSLAPGAKLVLLRVMNEEGISTSSIVKALQWVVQHHKAYNIRVVNLSVYGDEGLPSASSPINHAVRQVAEAGVVVVAAAGNDPNANLHAPANSIDAISVGGLNDQNSLSPLMNTLYHSTYGMVDELTRKPDVIAPAIWIPAPILPGTQDQRDAKVLFDLKHASTENRKAILHNELAHTSFPHDVQKLDADKLKSWVDKEIERRKYISAFYKHVDGTSFAAPIVCSLIAQILEANPSLDPITIREIILATSRFLPSAKGEQQGWGVVQPLYAVQMAQGKRLAAPQGITPIIDYRNRRVKFYFYHQQATTVGISGDFMHWKKDVVQMARQAGDNHDWSVTVPFEQKGIYQYKFVVDQQHWIADPRNPYRKPDGYNGFNSQLIIQ
jgi:serine protease AprX